MLLSRLTHFYLRKYRQKKEYLIQNKFIIGVILVNFFLTVLLVASIIMLMMGKLPLDGLRLTGAIKSTAEHEHCTYDNDFIKGTYMQDGVELVDGSTIRAKDIRAVRSSVSAYYMMSEGVLYIHGPIMFAERVEYPFKKDKDDNFILDEKGDKIIDILGIPQFHSSGNVGIYPDYKNNRVTISGLKFNTTQLDELAKELKPYLERM